MSTYERICMHWCFYLCAVFIAATAVDVMVAVQARVTKSVRCGHSPRRQQHNRINFAYVDYNIIKVKIKTRHFARRDIVACARFWRRRARVYMTYMPYKPYVMGLDVRRAMRGDVCVCVCPLYGQYVSCFDRALHIE